MAGRSTQAEMDELRDDLDLELAILESLRDGASWGSEIADDIPAAEARVDALKKKLHSMQVLQHLQQSSPSRPVKSKAGSSRLNHGTASYNPQPEFPSPMGAYLAPRGAGYESRVNQLINQFDIEVKNRKRLVERLDSSGLTDPTAKLANFKRRSAVVTQEVSDLVDACKSDIAATSPSLDDLTKYYGRIAAIERDFSFTVVFSQAMLGDDEAAAELDDFDSTGSPGITTPSAKVNLSNLSVMAEALPPRPSTMPFAPTNGSTSTDQRSNRKRSFGAHAMSDGYIKHEPSQFGLQPKSQRTSRLSTPMRDLADPFSSPVAERKKAPEVIDLTGDDDEVSAFLSQFRQQSESRPSGQLGSNLAQSLGQTTLASRPAPQRTLFSNNGMGQQNHQVGSTGVYQAVPGAYISSGDEDDSDNDYPRMNHIGLGDSNGLHMNPNWMLPPQPFTMGPLGSSTGSQVQPNWMLPSLNFGPGMHGSGAPASIRNRPGSLQNGLYNALGAPSIPNLAGQSPGYRNIISQSNIEFTDFQDGNGSRLSKRLQNVWDDAPDTPTDEEAIKNLLSTIRPEMEISDDDREPTPDALKYPLFPHQGIALKWMVKMEEDKLKKGGLLADDMGLGKTISTLSLIVRRPGQQPDLKTNLIVGPVALIKQWEAEIETMMKAGHRLKVFMLHGTKRKRFDDLRKYDVVLTTYGTLAAESKRMEQYQKQYDRTEAQYAEDKVLQDKCPLLHSKSRFWRIVLDEAQCIKNHNTQAARAVFQLRGEHRWCLSGTPMMNGAHELFSLIHFMRIAPYNESRAFTRAFGALRGGANSATKKKLTTNALQQLQIVLKSIMLRREKTSEINGKPILELPPKMEEVVHVTFSDEERKYYTDLEGKSQNQFNSYMRAGTLRKNYSNILVLLLRLRQACCHPHLNIDVEYTDGDISNEELRALAQSMSADVVQRIKEIEGFTCPVCFDCVEDPSIVLPCGHALCRDCLAQWISNAEQQNIQAGQAADGSSTSCPECRGRIDSKKVINYGTFVEVHMPEKAATSGLLLGEGEGSSDEDSWSSAFGSDSDDVESDEEVDADGNLAGFIDDGDGSTVEGEDDKSSDVDTPRIYKMSKGKEKAVVYNSDDDEFEAPPVSSRKDKGKRKGKPKATPKTPKEIDKKPKEKVKPHQLQQLRKESGRNKASRKKYFNYLSHNWMSSAKVSMCTRLLTEIHQKGEKTLIFSVWTGLLDLLEVAIRRDLGLRVCRYDGGMSREKRNESVREFQGNPEATILLVSLRAGNAGLNLTAASQVIIMDPFWNPYIEKQAVDRAHRMGQMRPVQVHRIIVKETVEDRIVDLQNSKREIVEAALNEGEAKNLARLSDRELRYLFGIGGR